MSKEYTGYLKGGAILMMVFLHLFNNLQDDLSLGYMFNIGEIPLIYYISRMCNPVPFFLILSGYGLYATYSKLREVKPCKLVCILYIHLWIIYLLLVPLACEVRPEMYPGSMMTFIKNVTSWRCSYIGEQWFFLPYIILLLASSFIFKLYDKLKWYWVMGVILASWITTAFVLKQYSGGRPLFRYHLCIAVCSDTCWADRRNVPGILW